MNQASTGGARPANVSRKLCRTGLRLVLVSSISYASLATAQSTPVESPIKATSSHHEKSHKKSFAKKRQAVAPITPTLAAASTAPASKVASVPASRIISTHSDILTNNSPLNEERVTVTGTRLKQSRLTNVMAGTTVTAAQLGRRGYYDLGTALLRENTAFSMDASGQSSPIGDQNSSGPVGQSTVSLLNLGPQRTLTLINGMRMVGASSGGFGSQVDVSTIPTSLIKGIDTKLGGAGAAYGSDAVAGVVNYTLDDNFKGVDFSAQGNWSQKLDAPGEKITFKAGTGFDHDKGGIVFDVEYRNNGGLVANDRADVFGRNALGYHRVPLGQTSPYTFVLGAPTRFIENTVTGMPQLTGQTVPVYAGSAGAARGGQARDGITDGNNKIPLAFSQDGKTLVPFNVGQLLTRDTTHAVGGDGIALQDYSQLYVPNDKLNLTTLGHYDFTDHIHATWQGWYARGTAANDVSQGTWSTPQFDDPLTLNTSGANSSSYYTNNVVNGAYELSTNNPFLTSAESTTIRNALIANKSEDTSKFYLSRLNQDLDAGLYTTTVQMFRFAGGLNGDFRAFNRTFNWKAQGEYSRYMDSTVQPSIITANLVNALNATRDASGNIVCAPGYQNAPIATRSSTCAPLNPFGYNQMTPAARDYVISDARSTDHNSQRDLQAEISSTVLRLPAGDVRWDLGYEHRHEGYHYNPGAYFRGWPQADGSYKQFGNFSSTPPSGGSYQTHEAFGELDVPIVSPNMHVPGIYNLSATANGRFIHNSISGNYWTYMFGGAWWPTRDFGFSGNYAQSVRNPSVSELFQPRQTDYEDGTDPCSDSGITQGPNPAQRARNCNAQGIKQPFVSNFNSYTIKGSIGGNPNLQNETSKSYTASLEFSPHFIRGLNANASLVDVKVSNAITSLDPQDLMDACYDSSSYPENAYCRTFTRDPSSGQLIDYSAGYFNIAEYETRALQANFDYYTSLERFGLPSSFGDIDLSGNYTHYLKSQHTYLGNTYLLSGMTRSPNNLFTLNANYIHGPFSAQWQTIWYGKSDYKVQVPETQYQYNKRPSFAYFNLSLAYDITKNFSANFVINNITGALPKYPGTYSTSRYYDMLIGRSFQLALGMHF